MVSVQLSKLRPQSLPQVGNNRCSNADKRSDVDADEQQVSSPSLLLFN